MIRSRFQLAVLVVVATPLLILTGCAESENSSGSTETTAPSGNLPSLQEAVAGIVALRDQIRDGFASDDLDAAHGPLHDIGDLLTQLQQISKGSELTKEQVNSLSVATDQLLDAFGAVDKTFHGGDGSTYEEEAETIDAAILIIADIAGVEVPASSSDTASESPSDTTEATDPVEVSEPTEVAEPVDVTEPVEVKEPEESDSDK